MWVAQCLSEGPRAHQNKSPERAEPARPGHTGAYPSKATPLVARSAAGSGRGKTAGFGRVTHGGFLAR
eukprot:15924978-Heterocapsa_arctica.AAC.1